MSTGLNREGRVRPQVPNATPKTLKDIGSLARCHTERMVQVLVGIAMQENAAPAARVAAAEALLDRGWGRPKQTIASDPDGPLIVEIIQRVREPK